MTIGGINNHKLVYVTIKDSNANKSTAVFDSNTTDAEIKNYLDKIEVGSQAEVIIEDVNGNLYEMNIKCNCSEEKTTKLSEKEKIDFKSRDVAREPIDKNIKELKNKYDGMPVRVEQHGYDNIEYKVGKDDDCLVFTFNKHKPTPQLEISRDLRTTLAPTAKKEIETAIKGPNSSWNKETYFNSTDARALALNIQKEIYTQLGPDFTIETVGSKTKKADSYLLTSKQTDPSGQPNRFLAIRVKDNEGKAYYQIYKLKNDASKESLTDFAKKVCSSISANNRTHSTNIFTPGGILMPAYSPEYGKLFAPSDSGHVMCAGKTLELEGSFGTPTKITGKDKRITSEPPGRTIYSEKEGFSFIGLFNYAKNTDSKGIYEQGSTLTEYGEKAIDELVYLYSQGLITEQDLKSMGFTTSYEGKDKATNKEDNSFNNEALSKERAEGFFKGLNERLSADKKILITSDEAKKAGKGEEEHNFEYERLLDGKELSQDGKFALIRYANSHIKDGLNKDDPDPKAFQQWVSKYGIKSGTKDYIALLKFHESGQKYRAGHMGKKLTTSERANWKSVLEKKFGEKSVIAQSL